MSTEIDSRCSLCIWVDVGRFFSRPVADTDLADTVCQIDSRCFGSAKSGVAVSRFDKPRKIERLRGLPADGCVCLRPPLTSVRLPTVQPSFSVSLQTSEAPMVCDHCIHTPIPHNSLPVLSHSPFRTLAHQGPKAEFSSRPEANPGGASTVRSRTAPSP